MTNHEVIRQVYVGKDKDGNKCYRVVVSSLMDKMNNRIGRYQATLDVNKDKTSSQVFESLYNSGAILTSLEKTASYYGIDNSWIIPATNSSEASVIIRGGLSENPSVFKVVNDNIVDSSGFKKN